MNTKLNRGVTLIELMIVTVVISILAAIAYPSYRQYVIRANRTEAKTALLQVQQVLERCYTNSHNYNTCVVNVAGLGGGKYTIALARDPLVLDEYTITATRLGGQTADTRCGDLSLNQTGQKTESGTGTIADCW